MNIHIKIFKRNKCDIICVTQFAPIAQFAKDLSFITILSFIKCFKLFSSNVTILVYDIYSTQSYVHLVPVSRCFFNHYCAIEA